MSDRTRGEWINLVSSICGAILAAVLIWFIIDHAKIPITGIPKYIWCLVFPFSMISFTLFTHWASIDVRHRHRYIFQDAYCSLAVIPFLLILLSWQSWGRWQQVSALFFFLYLGIRTWSALTILNQSPPRHQPANSLILYFIVATHLILFQMFRIVDADPLLRAIYGLLVTTCIAFLIRQLTERLIKGSDGFQNWIGVFVLISLPFFSSMSRFSKYHIIGLLILLMQLLWEEADEIWTRWGYPVATLAILLPPLAGLEYCGIALWATSCVFVRATSGNRERRFLETAGAAIVLMIGILTAILKQQGLPFSGFIRWPFNLPVFLFSSFLDIRTGLLFSSPVLFFCMLGYVWNFGKWTTRQVIWCIGPLLALLPVVIVSMIETGSGPPPVKLIPFLCFLVPYIAVFFNHRRRVFSMGVFLIGIALNVFISAIFFVNMATHEYYRANLESIFNQIANNTDLDFIRFFPTFSPYLSNWNFPLFFWSCLFIGSGSLLTLEKTFIKPRKEIIWTESVLFMLLIGIILSFTYITSAVNSWSSVEIEDPLMLKTNDSRTVVIQETEPVLGIRLVSKLGNAINIMQGEEIAEIAIADVDGEVTRFPIRAGLETAEWAYDRDDVLNKVAHQRPVIARTWIVNQSDGTWFEGHSYKAYFTLNTSRKLKNITISNKDTPRTAAVTLSIEDIRLLKMDEISHWKTPTIVPIKTKVTLNASNPEVEFALNGTAGYDQITILSDMANSADVMDGTAVSSIQIIDVHGLRVSFLLYAGSDTAEWSYDRADLKDRIMHSKAPLANSRIVRGNDNRNFLAHIYSTEKKLHPAIIPRKLKIRYLLSEETIPDGQLTVYSITFS